VCVCVGSGVACAVHGGCVHDSVGRLAIVRGKVGIICKPFQPLS
jgi:hypothetical protein